MTSVELRDIENYACQKISLRISSGEFVVFLGPNGAGKTTLLNVIAGLCEYRGSVLFDGRPVDDLPPQERNVGYVFQDLVLFPHMDAASNIAYGLKAQDWPKEKIAPRVAEMLTILKIERLAACYPMHLSGGEKQRVALARALAPCPRILLLDEPLSSLDFEASQYLKHEFKRLQRELGITTIYVTHNLEEAGELADRVVLISGGRIERYGKTGGCHGFLREFQEISEKSNRRTSDYGRNDKGDFCKAPFSRRGHRQTGTS